MLHSVELYRPNLLDKRRSSNEKLKRCLYSHLVSCCMRRVLPCEKVTEMWTSGRCDAALRSNRHFVWSILTPWGGNHRPLPGITEPAGQVWLTRHCSLDSCCDCQHTKRLAVFVFIPLRFLTRVAFDSSEPESADGLGSRVSVCTSQWSSCWEGCKDAKPRFHLHEVHIYSPRNLELLSKTLLWLSDMQLYNFIQNWIKWHEESLPVPLQKWSGFAGIVWGIY